MSGTSMDGLDIACIELFENESNRWEYSIIAANTVPLPEAIKKELAQSKTLSGYELTLLDITFGNFIGNSVNSFLLENKLIKSSIDAIASHGHTVFHQPEKQVTLQIGNGEAIAKVTGINTISNFREKDVMHGGQGAPLVPIGDKLLFNDLADSFLNLGGFANITSIKGNQISAFDISPCNLVLNHFSNQLGFTYDKNGQLGREEKHQNEKLLNQLNTLSYYVKKAPKSLGTEWLEKEFIPIFDNISENSSQKLRIAYEHISDQIAQVINQLNVSKTLVTGGGAKNTFLIELIQQKIKSQLIIPDETLIDYKEAIVFAFLGNLFLEGLPNCLSSVTGASKDVCGGTMYLA